MAFPDLVLAAGLSRDSNRSRGIQSDQQLRDFRQVCDAIPWNDVEDALHTASGETRAGKYADFVDRTASQQAAFIDLVVFLLAYASGPYLFDSAEQGGRAGHRRSTGFP